MANEPTALADMRALLAKTVSLNRELTERLVQRHHMLSEADQAKSAFLANVSHEIRTPLHAIINLANVLGDTGLDDDQSHYVQLIRDSGDHLLSLINDILDISKIAAGSLDIDPKATALHKIVDEAVAIVRSRAQSKDVELVIETAPGTPPAIHTDGDRLRQILINLLGNGVKFTPSGHVRLFLCRSGDTVRFIVEDTGPGIPPERMETIFEPFVQDGIAEGAGLGLPICRDLARAMGGDVFATSQPGKGARFTLTLPLKEAELRGAFPDSDRLQGRRVHLIEDHPMQRAALAAQLTTWGLQVTTSDALEAPDDADVILVDQTIDGGPIAWCHEQTTPTILMQSGPLHDAGLDIVVAKPPGLDELHNALGRALLQQTEVPRPQRFDPGMAKRYPLRILVAEDNAVNQIVAKGILARFGYECTLAGNGREAVRKAKDSPFDLILMDLQMPEVDGIQATLLIREEVQPPPYIAAMTAHASVEDRERCLRRGMDAYLSKPVRLSELTKVLRAAAERDGPKAVKSDP